MSQLANAAVDIVGKGLKAEDFLNYFGRCFVRSFEHYGYDKIIQVLIFALRVMHYFFYHKMYVFSAVVAISVTF